MSCRVGVMESDFKIPKMRKVELWLKRRICDVRGHRPIPSYVEDDNATLIYHQCRLCWSVLSIERIVVKNPLKSLEEQMEIELEHLDSDIYGRQNSKTTDD